MKNSFKDPEHLQALVDSQYKTIIELSKRIQELEDELKNKNISPVQTNIIPEQAKDIVKLSVSDQETICKIQILKLRDVSLSRELTLEEARKVEIYSKILSNLDNKNKDLEPSFKKLSDDELIKELSDNVAESK
jgi:cell division protein FtsB